ncbi:MAG: hypothetical protein ACYS0I_16070, partial [Planctomycetota bacterium]
MVTPVVNPALRLSLTVAQEVTNARSVIIRATNVNLRPILQAEARVDAVMVRLMSGVPFSSFCGEMVVSNIGFQIIFGHTFYRQLIQGSGYFFHGKMPGCCLPSLTAATALHFTAGYLKLSLQQEPTPCFAFLGGNSPLPIRSTGAII